MGFGSAALPDSAVGLRMGACTHEIILIVKQSGIGLSAHAAHRLQQQAGLKNIHLQWP
jgi:hypothetical protein